MERDKKTPGQVAYEAWEASRWPKKMLILWGEQTPSERCRWEVAANAVLGAEGGSRVWAMVSDEAPCVGRAVECVVCGMRKKPRGRSASPAIANCLCDYECAGYDQPPEPGHLWPGETREEFGYYRPDR